MLKNTMKKVNSIKSNVEKILNAFIFSNQNNIYFNINNV